VAVRDETVSFSLEINLDHAEREVRRLQTVLYRSLDLVQRACGSTEFGKFIRAAQKVIVMANRLRLALLALQAARMASGDPFAWALAGISFAEVGVDVATEMDGR
jgi:hypothetical protein